MVLVTRGACASLVPLVCGCGNGRPEHGRSSWATPGANGHEAAPVRAWRLSRESYEAFGDEIANDLMERFKRVDATYRSEFHDLFEARVARLESKLAQGLAETKAELRSETASGLAAVSLPAP